jgi:hypothetical protein
LPSIAFGGLPNGRGQRRCGAFGAAQFRQKMATLGLAHEELDSVVVFCRFLEVPLAV